MIHNSFAQDFIPGDQQNEADSDKVKAQEIRKALHQELLAKMVADTNERLRGTVKPVFLWTEVQKHQDDNVLLTSLVNEFLAQKPGSLPYKKNRMDRYGLMIYQLIAEKEALKPLSTKLFASIETNLKKNQITATDSSSRLELDQRAYYRYLYAYVNYLKAKATSEASQKEIFLKNAFDYSPDLIDKNRQAAYFYDMIFALSGAQKDSFQDDYLDFLTNQVEDKNQVLSTLRKMALDNPDHKMQLRQYYEDHHATGKDFGQYWQEAINSSAKIAPPISLALLDKAVFSTENLNGKWVLVDFWGTWCAPCRKEHPDMQKFYDSTVVKNPGKISLLTVACNDTEQKVLTYMEQKKYSFPVAMSDNKIQKTYTVQGYPTKVLITPQGKYVTVPFNVDWVSFVKDYSDL
ncbi:TlpA family protein disulfide reductase [Salmonirosea aquatica]|uniref:TlpA family protein disulfide reductase n=1 Tax=Salmonirosea aquatica TaxID=2654236 RepID=UPI003570F805